MNIKYYILIVLMALLASCKATRIVTGSNEEKSITELDSVHTIIDRDVKAITVPRESATITLTDVKLKELPEMASYNKSMGRASANVTRLNNEIVFTAECDSVTMLLENTRVMLLRYKQLAESSVSNSFLKEQIIVREPTSWQWFQIYGFRILLAINLLLIIFKRLKIWQKIFY